VVLGSLIHTGVDLHHYSPRQVKQAITGNGGADKSQVEKMIKVLLNIKELKMGHDQSDALAIAYCHALSL
jgi:crossover junction endodeoxyribonuclease RuvC